MDSKMQGFEPKIMLVDEAQGFFDIETGAPATEPQLIAEYSRQDAELMMELHPKPVDDPQTPQELFDAGFITFDQYREQTRAVPLPPETLDLLEKIHDFDETAQAYLRNRIASGRAAMALQGFNTEYKNNLPKLGSNPELHRKAVERRRKRKNGGHK